jgi:class 3 adenylate cyclase
MDLRQWDFARYGTVKLGGEWEFVWKKFLYGVHSWKGVQHIDVPNHWNGTKLGKKHKYGSKGYATYRLTVLLPPSVRNLSEGLLITHGSVHTSARMFVMDDGGQILSKALYNGRVGTSEKTYLPGVRADQAILQLEKPGKLILVVHVANYLHRKGGLTRPPKLGDASTLLPLTKNLEHFNVFLVGLFWFMSFYFLMMFMFHRKERGALWLGVFCLLFGVRTGLTEKYFYTFASTTFLWHQLMRLEYITMYLSFPTVLVFVDRVVNRAQSRFAVNTLSLASIVMSLMTLVTTPLFYTHLLKVFFPLFILASVYIVSQMLLLLWEKGPDSTILVTLLGFLVIIVAGAMDSLYILNLSTDVPFLKFGIFGFLVTQSVVLAIMNRRYRHSVEHLAEELESKNHDLAEKNKRLKQMADATSRFVPSEFLSLIGKDNIVEVGLGDHVEDRISILFSDIRSFTTLSESMTPRENFQFINQYLQCIEPVVARHNGFVDKYIGDGVMAIFQKRPDDAVACGIAMLSAVKEFNRLRQEQGFPPIEIGVGVNTGDVMLGTIGGFSRMDGTVISDAVNLAARLEGLTKQYGTPILISESTFDGLESPDEYRVREIDRIRPKGKLEAVTIYELYDADKDTQRQLKEEKQALFEQSIELYRQQKFVEAIAGFRKYLEGVEDKVAQLYIERCEYGLQRGVQSQWDATFDWHSK